MTAAVVPNRASVGEWRADAACRDADLDLFFPGIGDDARPAKAMCARCPVQSACFDEGLWEDHGVWAGTTPKERRRLRSIRTRGVARKLGDWERAAIRRRHRRGESVTELAHMFGISVRHAFRVVQASDTDGLSADVADVGGDGG